MIIYGTKQTLADFQLKLPHQMTAQSRQLIGRLKAKQGGDSLHEWGAKVFYFEYLRSIQLCNFASKFTLVIVGVTDAQIAQIAEIIFGYLDDIYADDPEMLKLIDRYAEDNQVTYFDKMTNRSIMATMNNFQTNYLLDGDRIYDFTEGNKIRTRVLNKEINRNHLVTIKTGKKKDYVFPAEQFKKLLKARYE